MIPPQEDSKGGKKAAECVSYYVKVGVNAMALAAQITGFVVWPLLEIQEKPQLWALPVAIALISCGWWENYCVTAKNSGKRYKTIYWRTAATNMTMTKFSKILTSDVLKRSNLITYEPNYNATKTYSRRGCNAPNIPASALNRD